MQDYPDQIIHNPRIQIQGGNIRLYHYGDAGADNILDPQKFGSNSYTGDARQWDKPRTFFYINTGDKENRVQGLLYTVDYPITKLYPFNWDPLHFYKQCQKDYDVHHDLSVGIQLSCIGDKAQKAGFDGMIMMWDRTFRVDIWKPVRVQKVETNEPALQQESIKSKLNLVEFIDSTIKNIIKEDFGITEEEINETSLSRIYEHMNNHDIAILTAFRNQNSLCKIKNNDPQDKVYNKQENLERNRELFNDLKSNNYSITKAKGSYVENYGNNIEANKPVTENSYLVVNIKDNPDFKNNIINLGIKYCQDSVLFKDKGNDEAYLIGTNNSQDIGYGKKYNIGKWHPKVKSEFFTGLGGNKNFMFQ